MITEELTADERVYADNFAPKLLRLYDAALARAQTAESTIDVRDQEVIRELQAAQARAEAAELKQEHWHAVVQSTQAMWVTQQRRACAAESRLAEATALIRKSLDLVGPEFREALRTFLSAAPAQAAREQSGVEIARDRLESWKAGHLSAESALAHICGCLGVASPEDAETVHGQLERALERDQKALESVLAERDTLSKLLAREQPFVASLVTERDTARACIAELEAENAEFRRLFSAPRKPDVKLIATLETLETYALELKSERARIARAVAELTYNEELLPLTRISRALEALR